MTIPSSIREVYEKADCIFTKNEVEAALDRMAMAVRAELEDKHPVVLCVMIGGLMTTAGLLSRVDFPLEVDYIHASRYQGKFDPSDKLAWKQEPSTSLKGRAVLIVDDILDAGLTMSNIMAYCEQQQAASLHTAILVDKQHPRSPGGLEKADYTGLVAPDRWLFGYGLDYKEYLRNAPGIYAAADEHIS